MLALIAIPAHAHPYGVRGLAIRFGLLPSVPERLYNPSCHGTVHPCTGRPTAGPIRGDIIRAKGRPFRKVLDLFHERGRSPNIVGASSAPRMHLPVQGSEVNPLRSRWNGKYFHESEMALFRSSRCRALENVLTPPTFPERRYYGNGLRTSRNPHLDFRLDHPATVTLLHDHIPASPAQSATSVV
jgi:hypothetical protein